MASIKNMLIATGFLIFGLLISTQTMAQADVGCDPLDPECPIDGGVSFLIAAGIGMGAKKAFTSKKSEAKS
ncbi:MAG: hypothetical protein FGM46_03710 [Ferruginibacter sp.]|nr:hypothetical protein [Ferruginibacter sp.]